MSSEDIRRIVSEIATETVNDAMRDGSRVAFDMAIALATSISNDVELSAEQQMILRVYAEALSASADAFIERTTTTKEPTA